MPILLGLVLVEAFFVFVVSAGTFTTWPTYTRYHDLQAEGFRAGHLHLAVEPSPELLRQTDPFDPRHIRLWLYDASLYRGHLYLYWGPVPALLLAAAKSALRISGAVGDQVLVFAFATLQLVFGNLLIRAMARRLVPSPAWWARALAHAVFSFATPLPWLVAHGAVYEVAIAGGQAFLVIGLYAAFFAVCAPTGDRRSHRLLLAAGLAWALALGCRVSLGPALGLLALVTVAGTGPWRGPGHLRPAARRLAWVGAPLAIAALLLCVYNWLRFDAFLDFGIGHQTTTMAFRSSSQYVAANLYSYLLRPLAFTCQFPWVVAPWDLGARAFPAGFDLPDGYATLEPSVGVLVAVPWTWLGIAACVAFGLRSLARRGSRPTHGSRSASQRRLSPVAWCASAAVILMLVTPLPFLGLFVSTMRYLADLRVGCVLAGTLGAWLLVSQAGPRPLRASLAVASALLAGSTIAYGVLLAYQSYEAHFERHNPDLHRALVERFSLCRANHVGWLPSPARFVIGTSSTLAARVARAQKSSATRGVRPIGAECSGAARDSCSCT
jgi:hypothetical protein